MSLESPWILAGLLMAAPVIWLHLAQRRRRKVPFPAVALLKKVSRRRAPRLKLRALLLLIARLLLVAALVLAMSRPGLSVRRPGGIRSGMALAQVILLDNSMSMRHRGRDGLTAFDRGRARALEELGRLRPGDASALVLTASPPKAGSAEVLFDVDAVRAQVEKCAVGFGSGDIGGALRLAGRLLEESPLPQREMVLITDLAEGGWDVPPDSGVGFRVIGIGHDGHPANAAVEAVRVETLGDGVVREATIEARIANHGLARVENLDVMLFLEGVEAARGRVDVPAGGTVVKSFHHRFEREGVHRGSVRIAPDGLDADDTRHFIVDVRKVLQVLVVNGDPRPGSYLDETFYLQRALATPTPREVPIKAVVVDPETAAVATLGEHDAVVLAGVENPAPSLVERLVAYVEKGGGLLISPDSAGEGTTRLGALIPGRVRSVRRARKASSGYPLGAVDRSHPIFEPFGDGLTGLEKVRVKSHLLLDPDPAFERRVLLELSGGLPLLTERRLGEGKVMLLGTTVDRDWSDLPIRPGYMPLLQRAVRYLAGRLGIESPRPVPVMGARELEASRGMRRLVVEDPEGRRTEFEGAALKGKTHVRFGATRVPGPYRVWAELPAYGGTKELDSASFVVVTDPRESDLEAITAERDSDVAKPLEGIEGRLPVWPYLLLAAVILFLLETWLAGVGLRRSHLDRPDG